MVLIYFVVLFSVIFGKRDIKAVFPITPKTVIDDLINKGYVTGRPILGFTCIQVSEDAARYGMTPGLYITEIDKNLAIADSELVVGDTITKVNGQSVTTTTEVSSILKDMKPGDKVINYGFRLINCYRKSQILGVIIDKLFIYYSHDLAVHIEHWYALPILRPAQASLRNTTRPLWDATKTQI